MTQAPTKTKRRQSQPTIAVAAAKAGTALVPPTPPPLGPPPLSAPLLGPSILLPDLARYRGPIACWPLPLDTPFIGSRELDILTEDLKRYVGGRVRGRSYLIAGHRGAGKTALTVHAVEKAALAVLEASVAETPINLPDGPLQRPLLVKLHGPSMLMEQKVPVTAPPVPAAPPEKPAGDTAATDKTTSEPAADSTATIPSGVHAALVQITIGLYRALAAEAATGVRAHAQFQENAARTAGRRIGDYGERAVQVALDLDSAADPARLRGHWQAFGRLARGMLWPVTADATLAKRGMIDQGLREIIALATAAQAFQVCTGRISYQTKQQDSLVRTETSELKGSTDFKEALSRLGTLGLGALTGVSVLGVQGGGASAAITAITAGLAVWLLGSLGLTWSRKNTRNDNRSVDYSFIRDFSLETLGRDLPLVITRVREAGLAPVFVIDELDKISDAPTELTNMVGQLKYLMADFGFFCFLVNRDCYDTFEAKIRPRAYPPEHTLFSERILVRPDPAYLLPYLMKLVSPIPAGSAAGKAIATFALTTMHEGQLNLTAVTRILSRFQQGPEHQVGTTDSLTQQRQSIIATVQIAIDQTLRTPSLVDRMAESASFAQLALDTLYYPSRLWADDKFRVDPSTEALKAHLEQRLNSERGDASLKDGTHVDAGAAPRLTVDERELPKLQKYLVQLLEYLHDVSTLRAALGDRNASGNAGKAENGDIQLSEIPPLSVTVICGKQNDGHYEFQYTRYGDPVAAEVDRMNSEQRERADFLIDYIGEFLGFLTDLAIDLDQLARTALLHSGSRDIVEATIARLEAAIRQGTINLDLRQDLERLNDLFAEISANKTKLAALFGIVASLARDLDDTTPPLPAVMRLLRFDQPPRKWLTGMKVKPEWTLPLDSKGLKALRASYLDLLLPAPGAPLPDSILNWNELAEPMTRFFRQPTRPLFLSVDYLGLLLAIRGTLPAAALDANLLNMTVGDWSALALAAIPRQGKPVVAPYWMFIAALRGLGFGRGALSELSDSRLLPDLQATGWLVEIPDTMTADRCFELAAAFAATATARPPGLVVVESDEIRFGAGRSVDERPTLIIDVRDYQDYLPVLGWLNALGIIVAQTLGVADEGMLE